MKIREIRMNVGRTINLGAFNSLRLDAGLTVETDKSDDAHAVRAEMHQELDMMLREAWHAHRRGAVEEE